MIAQGRPPAPPRRRILGLPADDLDWETCLDLLQDWSGSGGDRPGGARQVITLNPEHVMAAQRDPAFRAAIEAADLVTCDGVGLAWAGRRLGQALRAVIPGSDLLPRLAERAAEGQDRWFFLGGGPGVAERAAAALSARHPDLCIAGCHAGSPRDEDLPEILDRLRAAAPVHLLWVAFGSPAQELWIHRHRAALPVRVAVGVGGAFDFLAGTAPRPPTWVQRAGLIWLYRLVRQPWRWRRQAVLPRFVLRVLAASWRPAGGADLRDGS